MCKRSFSLDNSEKNAKILLNFEKFHYWSKRAKVFQKVSENCVRIENVPKLLIILIFLQISGDFTSKNLNLHPLSNGHPRTNASFFLWLIWLVRQTIHGPDPEAPRFLQNSSYFLVSRPRPDFKLKFHYNIQNALQYNYTPIYKNRCEVIGTVGSTGQLEYPYLALQFVGYLLENRDAYGRRKALHCNKQFLIFI